MARATKRAWRGGGHIPKGQRAQSRHQRVDERHGRAGLLVGALDGGMPMQQVGFLRHFSRAVNRPLALDLVWWRAPGTSTAQRRNHTESTHTQHTHVQCTTQSQHTAHAHPRGKMQPKKTKQHEKHNKEKPNKQTASHQASPPPSSSSSSSSSSVTASKSRASSASAPVPSS